MRNNQLNIFYKKNSTYSSFTHTLAMSFFGGSRRRQEDTFDKEVFYAAVKSAAEEETTDGQRMLKEHFKGDKDKMKSYYANLGSREGSVFDNLLLKEGRAILPKGLFVWRVGVEDDHGPNKEGLWVSSAASLTRYVYQKATVEKKQVYYFCAQLTKDLHVLPVEKKEYVREFQKSLKDKDLAEDLGMILGVDTSIRRQIKSLYNSLVEDAGQSKPKAAFVALNTLLMSTPVSFLLGRGRFSIGDVDWDVLKRLCNQGKSPIDGWIQPYMDNFYEKEAFIEEISICGKANREALRWYPYVPKPTLIKMTEKIERPLTINYILGKASWKTNYVLFAAFVALFIRFVGRDAKTVVNKALEEWRVIDEACPRLPIQELRQRVIMASLLTVPAVVFVDPATGKDRTNKAEICRLQNEEYLKWLKMRGVDIMLTVYFAVFSFVFSPYALGIIFSGAAVNRNTSTARTMYNELKKQRDREANSKEVSEKRRKAMDMLFGEDWDTTRVPSVKLVLEKVPKLYAFAIFDEKGKRRPKKEMIRMVALSI